MSHRFLVIIGLLAYFSASSQNSSPEGSTAKDTVMLREVVVQSTKPVTRIEGDGIVTTVKGTVLQELGTVKDVLGFLPGVSNNNGSIEVFGKGVPVIYVNGRIVRNDIELNQLRSDKIKEIKVINNPGARYGASTNAVIKISTVKELGDGFALDSKTSLGYRDYLYGKEELGMNYRDKGLDVFAMLEYNNSRAKGSSANIQNSWLEPHDRTELLMKSKVRSQLFKGRLGFNYTTRSNHTFGVYYQATGKPVRNNAVSNSSLWVGDNLEESSLINQRTRTDYFENIVDGYYTGQWGRWSANVTFDILWRDNDENQLALQEYSTGINQSITTDDESLGRLIAGEIHLSRALWKGSLNVGAEYANSRRSDDFSNVESVIGNSDNLIKENNIAVYGELMQRFGSVMAQVGLRYEHIGSDYFENGKKIAEQSQTYDEILPSIMVVIPFSNVSMLQIGYSRKYVRPLYSQLSSTVVYRNNNLYESGNPSLRTSFNDNVSANFKYKWLMLMASYKYVKDQIISACTTYGDNPSITLLKKDNSPYDLHNLQVMASVMPGFIGKYWYPVLSCGVLGQFYKADYRGGSKRLNNPMAVVQMNNIIRLPRNYMITAVVKWRSEGNSENIKLGEAWQVDLSATKTFNSHWDLKLSFNDIFNTARTNRFVMYSGVRDMIMEKCVNTRQVELSVNYKFNTTESKYKGKGAGNAEKDRL